MKPIEVFLIKPQPPQEVMSRQCPIPDPYRYDWMPMALKIMGSNLITHFGDKVRIKLYHLMNDRDEFKFFDNLQQNQPDMVAFSEIDILVNQVNRIAQRIKNMYPEIFTINGGKQTSLLRTGDSFPFKGIDMAIRGDGINALMTLVQEKLRSGSFPATVDGAIETDENDLIVGDNVFAQRFDISKLNLIDSHRLGIENHPFDDYLTTHQKFPSITQRDVRTSSLFIGTGCPHNCNFCQSPLDYGDISRKVFFRSPRDVAAEMVWLKEVRGVNNFFSLEPSLNLNNLLKIFDVLEQEYGISELPISGFVRAIDIVRAHKKGTLQKLVRKGMRVLSVGLDIPLDTRDDVYNKAFSYNDMMECLDICNALGILPVVTIIGDPNVDSETFKKQLDSIKKLHIADVDIRLTIALKNTPLFKVVEDKLIHNPSADPAYFDQQNYRYQTIQVPGKITPEQTYDFVNAFHKDFLISPPHITYVLNMLGKFPDTLPFFVSQYRNYERDNNRDRIPSEIVNALNL